MSGPESGAATAIISKAEPATELDGVVGPVTRIPAAALRPTLVIVAGEDPRELEEALEAAQLSLHAWQPYRCYQAWSDDDVTVVWTGPGSACLEPLLWECIGHARDDLESPVERALLIGTAGTLPGLPVPLEGPKAYWIHIARPVWQLLDDAKDTLLPRWPAKAPLPTAMALSTDRFYGFSPAGQDVDGAIGPSLAAAWRLHKEHPALVDMETAAFFHFCSRFQIPWFGAIRAPANTLTDLDGMPERSGEALRVAIGAALG